MFDAGVYAHCLCPPMPAVNLTIPSIRRAVNKKERAEARFPSIWWGDTPTSPTRATAARSVLKSHFCQKGAEDHTSVPVCFLSVARQPIPYCRLYPGCRKCGVHRFYTSESLVRKDCFRLIRQLAEHLNHRRLQIRDSRNLCKVIFCIKAQKLFLVAAFDHHIPTADRLYG